MRRRKDAALHCCRTASGVNNRSLASDLRGKGTNTLREVQVGFHLATTNKAHEAFATAIDPAGEFSTDGRVVWVGLYLA